MAASFPMVWLNPGPGGSKEQLALRSFTEEACREVARHLCSDGVQIRKEPHNVANAGGILKPDDWHITAEFWLAGEWTTYHVYTTDGWPRWRLQYDENGKPRAISYWEAKAAGTARRWSWGGSSSTTTSTDTSSTASASDDDDDTSIYGSRPSESVGSRSSPFDSWVPSCRRSSWPSREQAASNQGSKLALRSSNKYRPTRVTAGRDLGALKSWR